MPFSSKQVQELEQRRALVRALVSLGVPDEQVIKALNGVLEEPVMSRETIQHDLKVMDNRPERPSRKFAYRNVFAQYLVDLKRFRALPENAEPKRHFDRLLTIYRQILRFDELETVFIALQAMHTELDRVRFPGNIDPWVPRLVAVLQEDPKNLELDEYLFSDGMVTTIDKGALPVPTSFEEAVKMAGQWCANQSRDHVRGSWNEEDERRLREAFSRLDERIRQIIALFTGMEGAEKTLDEVGKQVGLTREGVRQIILKGVRLLRAELTAGAFVPLRPAPWPQIVVSDGENTKPEQRVTEEMVAVPAREWRLDALHALHNLSTRTKNCLANASMEYVWELECVSEERLLKTKNFGRKSLNELKEIMQKLGVVIGSVLDPKAIRAEYARHGFNIAPLLDPVSVLRLPEGTIEVLKRNGLRNIHDVLTSSWYDTRELDHYARVQLVEICMSHVQQPGRIKGGVPLPLLHLIY